ncbi:MAG: pyridoxamine 5'-phosphate oxidase family protein [Prevotella sp.]|nr:pyridoxamine 5'-phosphate oxidase family protein [Prevotella sp.]
MESALQFLREHRDVALATSEDNIPKLRIFQIMKREGNVLYFATSEKKAVWHELRKNPNVELIACEGNISVRCSGMVNFNVEEDQKRWIYDHNAVLSRLYPSYDRMVYFCLPIAEMDYYDLTPTPPVFKHFDLMVGEVSNGFVGEKETWIQDV